MTQSHLLNLLPIGLIRICTEERWFVRYIYMNLARHIIDNRIKELAEVAANLPSVDSLNSSSNAETIKHYYFSRFCWEVTISTIASLYSDEALQQISPEFHEVGRRYTDVFITSYFLIINVWEDLKPAAIKQKLIPPNAGTKDYLQLMYADEERIKYERTLVGKNPKISTVHTQSKFNLSIIKKLDNQELTEREKKRIDRRKRDRSKLSSLLLEVADRVRDKASEQEVKASVKEFVNACNNYELWNNDALSQRNIAKLRTIIK